MTHTPFRKGRKDRNAGRGPRRRRGPREVEHCREQGERGGQRGRTDRLGRTWRWGEGPCEEVAGCGHPPTATLKHRLSFKTKHVFTKHTGEKKHCSESKCKTGRQEPALPPAQQRQQQSAACSGASHLFLRTQLCFCASVSRLEKK